MDPEELLQQLLGRGGTGTPLKRDVHIRITRDSEGLPAIEILEGTHITISEDESVDSIGYSQDTCFSCGCPRSEAQIGVVCFACGRISCASCSRRCANPSHRVPLCILHAQYIEDDEGNAIPLCGSCFDEADWTHFLHRVTGGFISPPRF